MDTKYKSSRSPLLKGVAFVLCAVMMSFSLITFFGAAIVIGEHNLSLEDLTAQDYLQSEACYYQKRMILQRYLVPLLDYRSQEQGAAAAEDSRLSRSQLTAAGSDIETAADREPVMTETEREYEIKRLKTELEKEAAGMIYYATDGQTVISSSNQDTSDLGAFYRQLPSYLIADNRFRQWEVSPDPNNQQDRSYASFFGTSMDRISETYSIYIGMDAAAVAARGQEFQTVAQKAAGRFTIAFILFLLSILCGVYLFCVCGRKPRDNELHLIAVDRIWSELNLLMLICIPIVAGSAVFAALDECYDTSYEATFRVLSVPLGILGTLCMAAWLAFAMSAVRRLKDRSFLKNSAIVILCRILYRWIMRGLRSVSRLMKSIGEKGTPTFRVSAGLAILEGCLLLLGLLLAAFPGAFVIWILLFLGLNLLALRRLIRTAKAAEEIAGGVKRVKNGELDYQIPCGEEGLLGELASDINRISDGLKQSVENEIRAERMKAELITNVSHDLKTPLTSILNYSDLLSKEQLQPEFANDYVKVIHTKGEKLKHLTQDLFDISKAQSGTIEVRKERLDLALLVQQAMAEAEEKAAEAGLEMKIGIDAETTEVISDGRLLSRAVENLIGNILKYSLSGTRVYIDLEESGEQIRISFKNIANYEMNFKEEEIVERFVRGDSSRTTEGSGLGLAIAKSYVEACGGRMDIAVDGDLFKAVLTFNAAS